MQQTIQKTIYIALGLILGLSVVMFSTQAFQGGPNMKVPNISPEKQTQIETAIKNQNYDEWKKLITENGKTPKILEKINKDNFADYAKMEALMKEGKIDEANAIRTKLGIEMKPGMGSGMRMEGEGMLGGFGMMMNMKQNPITDAEKATIQKAIDNNDFNTWEITMTTIIDRQKATTITQDNFNNIVKEQALIKAGKFDELNKMREDLGFPMKENFKGMKGGKFGMHNNSGSGKIIE